MDIQQVFNQVVLLADLEGAAATDLRCASGRWQ